MDRRVNFGWDLPPGVRADIPGNRPEDIRMEQLYESAAWGDVMESVQQYIAETKKRRPFVIGGATIYEAAREYIDVWHVTEIDRDVKADVRFLVPDVPVTEVEESGVDGITFVTRKRAA